MIKERKIQKNSKRGKYLRNYLYNLANSRKYSKNIIYSGSIVYSESIFRKYIQEVYSESIFRKYIQEVYSGSIFRKYQRNYYKGKMKDHEKQGILFKPRFRVRDIARFRFRKSVFLANTMDVA